MCDKCPRMRKLVTDLRVRIPQDLRGSLIDISIRKDVPMSAVVREAVREYVNAHVIKQKSEVPA